MMNLSFEQVVELKVVLFGKVFFLVDLVYEEVCKIWNVMIDKCLVFIVCCVIIFDVVQIVNFVCDNEFLFVVCGGGYILCLGDL